MKLANRASRSLFIFVLLFLLSFFAQGDENFVVYESIALDDFDDPNGRRWIVQASQFTTDGFPKVGLVKGYPNGLMKILTENYKYDINNLRCLFVAGSFVRKGNNYIEIIPAKEVGGKYVPAPIMISGRAKSIDVWVLGANYNFTLEVHLQDYNGIDHTINMGSLKFAGWTNLQADIPANIPQAAVHLPAYKGLSLTKMVIWTHPMEKVDEFIVYFDRLKILSDIFESPFDGDVLLNPKFVEGIWDSTPKETTTAKSTGEEVITEW